MVETGPCGSTRAEPERFRVDLCVPEGTFNMGSSSANLGSGHADHTPPHEVTLSPYVIDAYEVTVSRFRDCVRAGSCTPPATDPLKGCTYSLESSNADLLPVSCVTAGQAATFCEWDEGRRLPTEAEWERAADDEDANYPWGSVFDCEHAVIGAGSSCKGQYPAPMPVGSHILGRSKLGAFDMSGNVAEWVSDFAGSYSSDPATDPTGPTTGATRIARGGSYLSIPLDGQVFARATFAGSTVGPIGFRCARSAGAD
ncbi:MAG: SUMF1/EgtB/PvdO family nonheme iron enzyme [Polyangiaceae bacterium]